MAEKKDTASAAINGEDKVDVNEANLQLDRAFGIVDCLFTLEGQGDGIGALCEGSLMALLDGAMHAIAMAKEAINPWMKNEQENQARGRQHERAGGNHRSAG